MINSLDPQAQSFLTGLNQIQQRLDTAQTELTTGLQINNVSDDPSEVPCTLTSVTLPHSGWVNATRPVIVHDPVHSPSCFRTDVVIALPLTSGWPVAVNGFVLLKFTTAVP